MMSISFYRSVFRLCYAHVMWSIFVQSLPKLVLPLPPWFTKGGTLENHLKSMCLPLFGPASVKVCVHALTKAEQWN